MRLPIVIFGPSRLVTPHFAHRHQGATGGEAEARVLMVLAVTISAALLCTLLIVSCVVGACKLKRRKQNTREPDKYNAIQSTTDSHSRSHFGIFPFHNDCFPDFVWLHPPVPVTTHTPRTHTQRQAQRRH